MRLSFNVWMKSFLSSFLRCAFIAPLLAVAVLAACSRATIENYERVEAGMSRDQVYEILGKPDEVSAGGLGDFSVSSESWKGHKQIIQVTFGGDKVALKSITPSH